MDNRRIIQDSIDYIEANLKTEFTAQELADGAGFSLFHYYRLFQLAVGIPVMQYITRRKLLNAVSEISKGKKMIDAALEYGFDTHAGFYKAFKREFGCAPSTFLKKHKMKRPYKPNLFQEERIMMTHKKIRDILKHWNLENETISDIFYENTGEQNHNACYVGNRYVIKFTANLGEMNKHIALSKALSNAGLSAAVPIKSADGREIIEDDELYFYLTPRLTGSQINAGDMYGHDYREKARFVGKIIGQLHLALQNVDAVVNDVNLYENVIHWAMPKAKQFMALPESLCNEYVETFGRLYSQLPRQIIHRNPNPGNIILSHDRWGFIDFELSERNIRIFDPCYAATGILCESLDERDTSKLTKWVDIYHNIMNGYDSVVRLSQEEREAIPYVILSNQLVCVAWLSEQAQYQDIFDANKKMTRWIVDSFQQLRIN